MRARWFGRRLRFSLCVLAAALSIGLLAAEVGARGPGAGGRARPNVSRGGPASHGSMRPSKSSPPKGERAGRPERRRDAGRERQEARREVRRDRAEFRQDVAHERREWYEDRRALRAGARLSLATYRSFSCRTVIAIIDDVVYHRCGSEWYRRYVHGGTVTYVVVIAPE